MSNSWGFISLFCTKKCIQVTRNIIWKHLFTYILHKSKNNSELKFVPFYYRIILKGSIKTSHVYFWNLNIEIISE